MDAGDVVGNKLQDRECYRYGLQSPFIHTFLNGHFND